MKKIIIISFILMTVFCNAENYTESVGGGAGGGYKEPVLITYEECREIYSFEFKQIEDAREIHLDAADRINKIIVVFLFIMVGNIVFYLIKLGMWLEQRKNE